MKKLMCLTFLAGLHAFSFAQNGKALLQAFTQSYNYETEADYDKAIQCLNAVYKTDEYPVNLRLGWLHYNKGDFFKSKDYYGRAVQLFPYAIEAKFGLALPLAALGNWDDIIQLYLDILKIAPKQNVAHYRLGGIYYERQEYEKAYHHAEVVVNLYPFDYDGLVLFAWINLKMGKTSQAQALFERALLVMPSGTSALEGMKNFE